MLFRPAHLLRRKTTRKGFTRPRRVVSPGGLILVHSGRRRPAPADTPATRTPTTHALVHTTRRRLRVPRLPRRLRALRVRGERRSDDARPGGSHSRWGRTPDGPPAD